MSTTTEKVGELHLIIGPMFSSKTTTLISKLDRHTYGQNVLAINHSLDTRYGTNGLRTHTGKSFPCIHIQKLADSLAEKSYQSADVIGIDEAQFFDDLVSSVQRMTEHDKKIVYVAGLSGNFRRECFGHIHELIPFADSVTLLNAVCMDCKDGKTPGLFSKLYVPNLSDSSDVIIGGCNSYKAVCRRHFC